MKKLKTLFRKLFKKRWINSETIELHGNHTNLSVLDNFASVSQTSQN